MTRGPRIRQVVGGLKKQPKAGGESSDSRGRQVFKGGNGMTITWFDFTEQMAVEANELALSLASLPDDEVRKVMAHLHDQIAATLRKHLGKKCAATAAKAFADLVQRQRGEFIASGFVDHGPRLH